MPRSEPDRGLIVVLIVIPILSTIPIPTLILMTTTILILMLIRISTVRDKCSERKVQFAINVQNK